MYQQLLARTRDAILASCGWNFIEMSSNTTDSPSPADRSRQKVGQIAKERDILHAVAEVAGALIMVLSNNGEIVFFNRACETLTGYTAQEVKGRRPWTLLVCPEQVAEVEAVFAGLKAGSLPVKKEHCWQARDGSLHLISWTNTAMFDKTGKLEYIIAAGLDTTEQQVIEKALRRRSRELAERVKELNCLYEISRLREQQELLMPEVLQQVVEIIPPSWTYPQIARARIILRGKAFISKDFKESRWSMNSLLKACGEQVGMVEVFYLEQRPKKDEGPF